MFASGNALWLSEDGLRLAIASFDDSGVDAVMHFQFGEAGAPDGQYPELVELRYPKVYNFFFFLIYIHIDLIN